MQLSLVSLDQLISIISYYIQYCLELLSPKPQYMKLIMTARLKCLYSQSIISICIINNTDDFKCIQTFDRILYSQGIGIMVGLCYLGTVQQTQNGVQSFQGVFFMLITENFFTPMYSVMNQLPVQLPLFRREYTSGLYDAPTFYLANMLSFVSEIKRLWLFCFINGLTSVV